MPAHVVKATSRRANRPPHAMMAATVTTSTPASATPDSRPGRGDASPQEWTIEPRAAGPAARGREVWAYRRLLGFFARRALEKLHRNTMLGRTWLLIRPLFPLLVKTLIFGSVLGLGSDGVPYFLFLVVGTAGWDLFASGLMWATRSLELNRGFLARVYVPRVILPVAMLTPGLFAFVIHVGVIAAGIAFYYLRDGHWYLASPEKLPWALLALVLMLALALAIGFFTAVLATAGRDVRFTLAYVLDFWAILTPILYPLSTFPAEWRWVVLLNPMAAFIETFKYGLLGIGTFDGRILGTAAAITVATFIGGLWFFGRAEASAVDRI